MYSGFSDSNLLDIELKREVGNLSNKSLTIFLSNSDDFKAKYVYPIIEYFSKCGFMKIAVCLYSQTLEHSNEIAKEYTDIKFIELNEAFQSDAIFLSGGSNYYFLNSLRKNQLISKLQDYAEAGHLLIGMSAGSMLMQGDITNSEIPSYDPEPNPVGEISLESLNLFSHYFFPHFDDDSRFIKEVQTFANKVQKNCYVCHDSDGLYVQNKNIVVIGNTIVISPTTPSTN